jgi:hypothetical protein
MRIKNSTVVYAIKLFECLAAPTNQILLNLAQMVNALELENSEQSSILIVEHIFG